MFATTKLFVKPILAHFSSHIWLLHAQIQTVFFREGGGGGVKLWQHFFVVKCERNLMAIIGQPVKRHLKGVSLASQWWPIIKCWLCSFVIFLGIRTNIAKKPYIFVIFQKGSGHPVPPPPPPLWICTSVHWHIRSWLKEKS